MKLRWRLGCLLLLVALAVTGCAQTGGNTAIRQGHPSVTASPSVSVGTAFEQRLLTGAAAVRTVHVTFRFGPVQPNGQPDDGEPLLTTDGEGAESLAGGRVTSVDLAGHVVPGYQSRLVGVGGTLYVQLPPELNNAPKPWAVVSPNSAIELVGGLAGRLQGEASFGAPYFWATMAGKATRVSPAGTDLIGDVHAAHYELHVPATAFLGRAGNGAPPDMSVDLWIDGQNRLVEGRIQFGDRDTAMGLTENFDAFDAPVTITPPARGDINIG